MPEIHELTEKEIKAIDDAVSVVKKFSKYIKSVNLDNACLRRNLDESIKAGDVTNEQKVNLRCHETAKSEAELLYSQIRAQCNEKCPNAKECPADKKRTCQLYQDFIVAEWMRDVAEGSRFAWDAIFKYARLGANIMNARRAAREDIGMLKEMLLPEVKELVKFAKAFNI